MASREGSRLGQGLAIIWVWEEVRGDSGFVGLQDGAEVGERNVMEWSGRQWTNGEGSSKLAWKSIDEGGVNFMRADVWLVVAKENTAEGGGKAEVFCKLVDGQVLWYLGWESKRGA